MTSKDNKDTVPGDLNKVTKENKAYANYLTLCNKKYNVALKLINKILVNIGKEPIDDLMDFKMIDREDLAKPENLKIIEEMEEEIFKVFNKKTCDWLKRNKINEYQFTILKVILSELNLKFSKSYKQKIRVKYFCYTIVPL